MGTKILIVDDDTDIRRGLNVYLQANGYEVVFAADAISAMSVAMKERPDLIILDIGLPAGDGYMVMERLQNYPALACTPVIVLSARDAANNKQRALDAGAYAFLQKPADPGQLLKKIRAAMESRRVTR
jgi:two-component system KDP operon response regulator KdpE